MTYGRGTERVNVFNLSFTFFLHPTAPLLCTMAKLICSQAKCFCHKEAKFTSILTQGSINSDYQCSFEHRQLVLT